MAYGLYGHHVPPDCNGFSVEPLKTFWKIGRIPYLLFIWDSPLIQKLFIALPKASMLEADIWNIPSITSMASLFTYGPVCAGLLLVPAVIYPTVHAALDCLFSGYCNRQ